MLSTATVRSESGEVLIQVQSKMPVVSLAMEELKQMVINELDMAFEQWDHIDILIERAKHETVAKG